MKIMSNYKLDYWIEAVSAAFDEHNLTYPADVVESIAKDMMNAAEMQGQAFGYDAIPNPMNSEIEELKRKHKLEIEEYQKREMIFKQSVANLRGVRVENLYIEGDSVMYYMT